MEFKVLTDTLRHISEVAENLSDMIHDLEKRSISHDRSKLEEFEFDIMTEKLPIFRKANRESKEYKKSVTAIRAFLDHHYDYNRHHPQFHKNGFADMNLLDILEMIADWKAINKNNSDLSFKESLPETFEMYNIPKNMQKHIIATLEYLDWIEN